MRTFNTFVCTKVCPMNNVWCITISESFFFHLEIHFVFITLLSLIRTKFTYYIYYYFAAKQRFLCYSFIHFSRWDFHLIFILLIQIDLMKFTLDRYWIGFSLWHCSLTKSWSEIDHKQTELEEKKKMPRKMKPKRNE